MGRNRDSSIKLCILVLFHLTLAAIFITHCDARRSIGLIMKDLKHSRRSIIKSTKKIKVVKHIDGDFSSNTGPYGVSSPFSMLPYDSLAPLPLPENAPPYCLYPPFSPQPPSTDIPSPTGYTPSTPISPILPILSPPPSPTEGTSPSPPSQSFPTPSPPDVVPSPFIDIPSPSGPTLSPPYYEPSPPSSIPSPSTSIPSPIGLVPSPSTSVPSPIGFIPSPSSSIPSPTGFVPSPPSSSVPSPTGFVPSPPVFQPPVVFPPPIGRSPPKGPSISLWCVAKPSVPDPIIQEAMNYACASGADCETIQPSGSCFQPNTMYAHASYAFNSYWQRTKVAGGTCSFGGTAMLVTVDPSFDGCHFIYF